MLKYLIAGIALGLLSALLSLMAAGGGHGWNSALPFGLMSLVLYPCVSVAYTNRGPGLGLVLLAVLAVFLDGALVARTLREGVHYMYAVWPFAVAWLALWLFWQVAVIAALVRRRRHGVA
ncbi:hypothetical protein ASE43_16810 [Lysobacter sp. Root983]|uniref:hypothetical protein n=1 Tax=Lysobacter sp. Root916 TaxID=1736606 RepID=UPI00070999FE|nr:hypothetical protein [Lysobacter sp. Root916]KRD38985.1 hypothetical protein ASE35_01015 [Lysobacter sp. Root916]KRD74868.1 hypothetical protein ASE43_16810 [Lysobacter sp. Root983]